VPRYPCLQHFSKPFDSLKSGTWQGKEIRGMIRTLAANCAPIHDCSNGDRKTTAENTYDEMVMGAVRALCAFSRHVSQQNHSDLSSKALVQAQMRFYQKKGIFREQKMSKSAKAKADDLLAMESHQLREENIQMIRAAMEALVYWAAMVSTTKYTIFQVRLDSARQAATTWSDADWKRAIERLQREIHQVTPAKRKLCNRLFQRHEQ